MRTFFLVCSVLILLFYNGCGKQGQAGNSTQQNTVSESKPSPSAATTPSTQKSERGTPDEAKAMMLKAIGHYDEVGRKQALADFNAKKAPFGDRDLYVACVGPDHVIVANGGFTSLVGASADAWRDADGNSLGKATADAVAATGEATIRYRWYNPLSKKIEPKIGFFQKAGDDICGVGAYNP